jgi:hypothetical protein
VFYHIGNYLQKIGKPWRIEEQVQTGIQWAEPELDLIR